MPNLISSSLLNFSKVFVYRQKPVKFGHRRIFSDRLSLLERAHLVARTDGIKPFLRTAADQRRSAGQGRQTALGLYPARWEQALDRLALRAWIPAEGAAQASLAGDPRAPASQWTVGAHPGRGLRVRTARRPLQCNPRQARSLGWKPAAEAGRRA